MCVPIVLISLNSTETILVASSRHPREDITRNLGVSDVLDEDATRLVRNKSCVSGSWNLANDTIHGQTGSTIHRSRPPADIR